MQDRKILGKKDLLLILVLLVLAGGIWMFLTTSNAPPEEAHAYAEIYFGQHLAKAVPLHIDQTFSVDHNPNVVFEVRDGSIAFLKSNCPDQVCVMVGFINSPWHFAACLPNFLLLTIRYDEELHARTDDTIDSVAR